MVSKGLLARWERGREQSEERAFSETMMEWLALQKSDRQGVICVAAMGVSGRRRVYMRGVVQRRYHPRHCLGLLRDTSK